MRPYTYLLAGLALFALSAPLASIRAAEQAFQVAAGPPPHDQSAQPVDKGQSEEKELTLGQKFRKRFPQSARAGHLIGMPVLDDDDSTIGYVRQVVRAPDGKVSLIVPYSRWFGWLRFDWGKRLVAVPIEAAAILALQLNSLEMSRDDFNDAPTWTPSQGQSLLPDEKILVALSRR